MEESSEVFVHSVPGTCRLIPSAGRWNSIEVDYGLLSTSSHPYDFVPAKFSKSFEFNLSITDKAHLKRFIFASVSLLLLIILIALLATLLPRKHGAVSSSSNLPLALDHALLFFDAQKSGRLRNDPIKFRGDSGLRDGHSGQTNAILAGGFYDSGNNIKFSFPTAYTITLLCWTVIEYHQKYTAVGQLDHIKDIIRWGSDYLIKLYVPSNSTSKPPLLYSQVGSGKGNGNGPLDNDITCWQRPEDMSYSRPVSICRPSAADLAGEIVAALAASSLVFSQDQNYSKELIQYSESLFEVASNKKQRHETYTATIACGGEAWNFYNSSGYRDELAWGGTWLFFATGNTSYLKYATNQFERAVEDESPSDNGVFYWNNKLAANAVLLTRLRYLHDPGYPYETTLNMSSDMASMLMCSYLSPGKFNVTTGGLILMMPNNSAPLQFAATAAFLSKIYSDYLKSMQISSGSCTSQSFTIEDLNNFARSQVDYILGNNPMKLSYLVGFGDNYPKHVHHRAASIPWDDKYYNCEDGKKWRDSKDPNPNDLVGAMVGGPNKDDGFFDDRGRPEYTEATIASNAGLVAALVALLDDPSSSGVDSDGIFANIPVPLI